MEKSKREVLVNVRRLTSGMVVGRDVYSKNERLLVAAGTVLDDNIIAHITFFGVLSIYILIEGVEEEELYGNDEKGEKLFREFHKTYETSIIDVAYHFNQIIENGKDVDEDAIIDNVDAIIAKTNTTYHVFDMLHYIHVFDDETYMHSVNCALICNIFAGWLGMSETEKQKLTLCGLFHDIGKLLINKDILKKPGQLTEAEYQIIKQHPGKGYNFLKEKNMDKVVLNAVLFHHERRNGTGYPMGLNGSDIEEFTAITAIADVYDAMTSNRVYRKGFCPFKVIRIFEQEGKEEFTPEFLVPVMRNLAHTYVQHKVKLNDGRKGTVLLVNEKELSRPSVLVGDKLIDLSKQRNLEIMQVF